MHLKNFFVIHKDDVIALSPAYDLLSTTIAMPHPEEELALPLNGKKSKLKKQDLIDYFGKNRLEMTTCVIDKVLLEIKKARAAWEKLLAASFLSEKMRKKYLHVLEDRFTRLYK